MHYLHLWILILYTNFPISSGSKQIFKKSSAFSTHSSQNSVFIQYESHYHHSFFFYCFKKSAYTEVSIFNIASQTNNCDNNTHVRDLSVVVHHQAAAVTKTLLSTAASFNLDSLRQNGQLISKTPYHDTCITQYHLEMLQYMDIEY